MAHAVEIDVSGDLSPILPQKEDGFTNALKYVSCLNIPLIFLIHSYCREGHRYYNIGLFLFQNVSITSICAFCGTSCE